MSKFEFVYYLPCWAEHAPLVVVTCQYLMKAEQISPRDSYTMIEWHPSPLHHLK